MDLNFDQALTSKNRPLVRPRAGACECSRQFNYSRVHREFCSAHEFRLLRFLTQCKVTEPGQDRRIAGLSLTSGAVTTFTAVCLARVFCILAKWAQQKHHTAKLGLIAGNLILNILDMVQNKKILNVSSYKDQRMHLLFGYAGLSKQISLQREAISKSQTMSKGLFNSSPTHAQIQRNEF